MNILIVGGGGREYVIAAKLRENPRVKRIYAAPGNGGMAAFCTLVPLKATDIEGICRFAKENSIDYAVVAQDDPLCLGMVDALKEIGVESFGPTKAAAQIEGSKVFAKKLMKKYGIPTAACECFDSYASALEYVKTAPVPIVVKADGLALGKGVIICESREEAAEALKTIILDKKFGASGESVVIEEFLTGPEVSVLAFTDGKTVVPMVSSMDHKRALDGDRGLNTGGMGTIAPNPFYTKEVAERAMKEIFVPTIEAMNAEGRPFKGCLYFGLMITKDGPKVIEYNCRFGDPEAQVVLPLMKSDLLTVMLATTNGTLDRTPVEFFSGAACCVIIASGGYPVSYGKGYKIYGIEEAEKTALVCHAGTKEDENGDIVTSGGRVLGVVARAETLSNAVDAAYAAADKITFKDAFMRRDIGARALKLLEG
ncbi:MAG: phosphoribosylamine--glycine ligase [Clostridia bacterium]|nr:phosphoribosylamine--glycine ligase [Clostridia bacterium]